MSPREGDVYVGLSSSTPGVDARNLGGLELSPCGLWTGSGCQKLGRIRIITLWTVGVGPKKLNVNITQLPCHIDCSAFNLTSGASSNHSHDFYDEKEIF